MGMDMSTRTAVVIGAGRGIGAATAEMLAREGNAVVLADVASDDPRLPYALATPADLEAAGERTRALARDPALVSTAIVDICDQQAVTRLISGTEAEYGGVDVVVVTAGVIAGGVPLWDMPAEQIQAVIDVNLQGAINAACAGIPALLRRPAPRQGRFVAVASAAGSRGMPMIAAYCAAKAGVLGLVRALGAELRGSGITANAVSPGSTDTRILAESARLYALEHSEAFASQQPLGRLINASEVARVIAYLAGPESAAITGADYAVDGGLAI
jgi:SDR family mycofactocin-dependent oxidoreductase